MTNSLKQNAAQAHHNSATESELKFAVPETEVEGLTNYLNQHFKAQPTLKLSNLYFDTVAGDLHQLRIGCRIRRWQLDGQQHAEQTIKLAGQVVNGLHQRPEYNLPQDKQEKPDLTRFAAHIWPPGIDLSRINDNLRCEFKVDFIRHRWHCAQADTSSKSTVEISLDQGFIIAGHQSEPVLEIEIELLSGELDSLFEIAKTLTSRYKLVEFNKSKAQRGFALARG